MRAAVSVLVVLLVAGALAVVALGVPMPWQGAPAKAESPPPPSLGVKRVEGQPNTLLVPKDVREALGIRVGGTDRLAVAAKPTAAYDAKWGQSVISGALFTRLVYRGV